MAENQREIRARLEELDGMRILLEEARSHAKAIGGTDGARIEEEIKTSLREISKLAADLRAFLP